MKVKDIIAQKGSDIYSVTSDDTVFNAIKTMSELKIGALLVMNKDSLSGIISERDYRDKVILMGKQSKTTTVNEIMTRQVYKVELHDDLNTCMRIMTNQKIRHLPVMKGEKVVGVISIGDVVKSVIDEQKFEIDSLKDYIAGGYPG
jgi:CBS domain-containing protein